MNFFVEELVQRKARRIMVKWIFGPLEKDVLIFLIKSNKTYIGGMPQEYIDGAIVCEFGRIPPHLIASVKNFDAAKVYTWIPEQYQAIIESVPNGKTWAMNEMEILRTRIFS